MKKKFSEEVGCLSEKRGERGMGDCILSFCGKWMGAEVGERGPRKLGGAEERARVYKKKKSTM